MTTRFPDGIGFLANQYASPAMAPYAPAEPVPSSPARLRNIRHWIEARRQIGMDDLQRLMADPATGVCQCGATNPTADDPVVTLWSWTAAFDDPVLCLAKGTPNEAPYETAAL